MGENEGKLSRWYCDIGSFHLSEDNSLTFEDLLFDVIVNKDGSYQVLDIGEAAEAYRKQLITEDQLLYAMEILDSLLTLIHNGQFRELQQIIDQAC